MQGENLSSCYSIHSATTLANYSLNCDLEKRLYTLQCRVCGDGLYVGKAKKSFFYTFNGNRINQRVFKKGKW